MSKAIIVFCAVCWMGTLAINTVRADLDAHHDRIEEHWFNN